MNMYLHHTALTHTALDLELKGSFGVLMETPMPLCWLVFCQRVRVIQRRGTSGEKTLPTEWPAGMSVGSFRD